MAENEDLHDSERMVHRFDDLPLSLDAIKKNPIRIISAEFGLQLILCFQFCTIGLAVTDYLPLNLWLECNAH